jgi:hypothetical protein
LKENDIQIIDIEASGFSLKSYPIEIAWRSEDGSFDSFLIKPHEKWTHWSNDSESVHGIPRQKLLAEGISLDEACQRLNLKLKGKTVYSDNAAFDTIWIEDLFYYASEDIKPEFSIKQINALYYFMGSKENVRAFNSEIKKSKAAHRALDDCDRYIDSFKHFWPEGLKANLKKQLS